MPFRAQTLVSHLDRVLWNATARPPTPTMSIRARVLSPLVPPSQPCLFEGHSPSPTSTTQFEPDRSSLTSIVSSGASLLVPTSTMARLSPLPCHCRPNRSLPGPCVISSPMVRVSPPPCCLAPDRSRLTPSCHFKPNGSYLAPTMTLRARSLASGPLCDFEPNGSCLAPSALFCVGSLTSPRPSCRFEPDCSSPTPTMPKRSSLCPSECSSHVFSSPGAHHPPRPDARLHPSEPERSCSTSTMRSRARSLVSYPHHVSSSWNARLLPPPRQSEPGRSSPASTSSFRAQSPASLQPHPFEPDRSSPT